MARNIPRLYVPLDVLFFDDDRVAEAGERAGWLLLAMYCQIKASGKDGVITRTQISRLNVSGWQRRLDTLIEFGLVQCPNGGDCFVVPSWLKWNESQATLCKRKEDGRKAAEARWSSKRADDQNGGGE